MLQVVYIPGLGDKRITFQRLAVRLWRIWGVSPYVFHMKWYDMNSYAGKYKGLLATIDRLSEKGPVALVGASAGAGPAVSAYTERADKIVAIICIAGKINGPQAIAEPLKRRSPAFWESAQRVPASLEAFTPPMRARVVSVRSVADSVVPARDSIIPGANNRVVRTRGHALTIAWQLVFGARSFLRFAKQQKQQ